jgi:hypothetical protein
MAIQVVTFKITGKSPLMQSNPATLCMEPDATALGVKKKYDDAEEAALRVYLSPDGQFVHPSAAFRKCMMTAVFNFALREL